MLNRLSASVWAVLLFTLLIIPRPCGAVDRKISEEALLFQSTRDGVFTIFGDIGQGSGFLIDRVGLVLTNAHVVSHSRHIRVQLNDSLKIAGEILASDEERDLAVIRINSEVCDALPELTPRASSDEPLMEGEKVIAIGSPLHQSKILTTGIISKIEEDAVISDVSINPGNSGGPLLTLDGKVVAVNTFRDPSVGGPGVAGSVRIELADRVIEWARVKLPQSVEPSAAPLPVLPKSGFPIGALRSSFAEMMKQAESARGTRGVQSSGALRRDLIPAYEISSMTSTGDYTVTVITPQYAHFLDKRLDWLRADRRRARERKGDVGEEFAYDPSGDLRTWTKYVGEYPPVVAFEVSPKVGATTGSIIGGIFAAGLLGVYVPPQFEFKGDLADFSLLRDDQVMTDIQHNLVMRPLWDIDVAQSGIILYAPDVFAPSDSAWPNITLTLTSVDDPENPHTVKLPRKTVESIWRDFAPLREEDLFGRLECIVP